MALDDLISGILPEPATPVVPVETRNALDPLGNIIGTISLPVGTPESVWTARLNQYSHNISNTLENILDTITLNATAQTTTSSATAAVVGGMTKTPGAGRYIALFSGSIYTSGASAVGEFGIYVDGVLVTETRRDISCNLQLLGGLVTISLNAIGVGTYTGAEIDLNGSQTIEVRFRSTNGGTIGFKERVLTLIKVR